MKIETTRFGQVEIEAGDILRFPSGVIGLENCRDWVLLADAQNQALGWLQCTTHPEVALAVVSPRRFVPDFQLRVARSELSTLELPAVRDAKVLVIVGKNEHSITLNLKAPLVVNLQQRVGRQVVASGEQPVQYELHTTQPLRKIA